MSFTINDYLSFKKCPRKFFLLQQSSHKPSHAQSNQQVKLRHNLQFVTAENGDRIPFDIDPEDQGNAVPFVMSENSTPSSTEKFELAILALLLRESGRQVADKGKVLNSSNNSIRQVKLQSGVQEVAKCRQKMRNILLATKAPPVTLGQKCLNCCFRSECQKHAEELDDVSLMKILSSGEVDQLRRRGIMTVTQLADSFRAGRAKMIRQRTYPPLKARAFVDKKIYLHGLPNLHMQPTAVYLDVESIPDEKFYYLVRAIAIGPDGRDEYLHWCDTKNDEVRAWKGFISFLNCHRPSSIVSYGSFEAIWAKTMHERYSRDVKSSTDLTPAMVNILKTVYTHVYFPTFSNSLKEVASFSGYKFQNNVGSGLESIAVRKNWERTQDPSLKADLLKYNLDDCLALEHLTGFILNLTRKNAGDQTEICSAESLKTKRLHGFGTNKAHFEEFEQINKSAYFDYQHDKIFWRTDKHVLKSNARKQPGGVILPVQADRSEENFEILPCPHCRNCDVRRLDKVNYLRYDLAIRDGGMRREVTNFTGCRYACRFCKTSYSHPLATKYGAGLRSWIVYSSVILRKTYDAIVQELSEIFGYQIERSTISRIKEDAAQRYAETFDKIVGSIRKSHSVHVDETKISIKGANEYIWVFTNLEDVVFQHSAGRDGEVLKSILPDFKGVLISDFYSVYDSVKCPQQRKRCAMRTLTPP